MLTVVRTTGPWAITQHFCCNLMYMYSVTYQLLTASILNLAWRLMVRSENVMNYIPKNWIVKKRWFCYCCKYSTLKYNHDLYFLQLFHLSFFFSFQFWSVYNNAELFANYIFGNPNTADAQGGVPRNNIHWPKSKTPRLLIYSSE